MLREKKKDAWTDAVVLVFSDVTTQERIMILRVRRKNPLGKKKE